MKHKRVISLIIIILLLIIGYQYRINLNMKNRISGLYTWNIHNLSTLFAAEHKKLQETDSLEYEEAVKYMQEYSDTEFLTAVLPSSWNFPLIRCLSSISNDFRVMVSYMDKDIPIEEINKVKSQAVEKIAFLDNLFQYIYENSKENYEDKYYKLDDKSNEINKKVIKELDDFIEKHKDEII